MDLLVKHKALMLATIFLIVSQNTLSQLMLFYPSLLHGTEASMGTVLQSYHSLLQSQKPAGCVRMALKSHIMSLWLVCAMERCVHDYPWNVGILENRGPC